MAHESEAGGFYYDPSEFLQLYGDDPDLKAEILQVLTSETPGKLERLRRAIAGEEGEEIARAAHSLANTAGTMRSEQLLATCRELEAVARAGETGKARELAEAVQAGFNDMLAKAAEL